MVELEVNGSADEVLANKENLVVEKGACESEQDAEVDMEAVRRARDLLREEFEGEPERYQKSKYYEELMDPKSARTCWRYLKEHNGSLSKALEAMKKTIAWRLERNLDDHIDISGLAKEFWLFAPLNITGTTKTDQDVFYIVGQDYKKADAKLRGYVIKFVENILVSWDRKNRRNFRQLTVVFDVTDTGYRSLDLEFMTWLIGAMAHFPDRVHHIYVVGIPFIIRPFVRLVISLLPSILSSRVYCGSFEELIEANIAPENYPERVGGCAPETMRLAPEEACWLSELPDFQEDKMLKSIEYTLCSNMSLERREALLAMQRQHELRSDLR